MKKAHSSSKMATGLTEPQETALIELKQLIQEALDSYQLTSSSEGDVTIWGIPLVGDERSDLVILKFLRAKGFDVLEAFTMIKNTLRWRNQVGAETILEEDFDNDYKKVLVHEGYDKKGYPVFYLVVEEYMYYDEERPRKFLLRLVQSVEKHIRKLGNSFVLVIDLKNCSWYENRELYKLIYRFLQLLQDHYPEFVAKQLWINVSWWYRAYSRAYSVVFDEWSTKEVVYSGSSKTTETLFRYISPGQVPVKYGGLSRDDKQECVWFTADDPVTDVTIKPEGKHTAEFSFAEACDVVWELRVVGQDVSYEAEFVPSMQGSYTTSISKPRKLTTIDEPVIFDSFRVSEPGKLVFTIHNPSSKKKKLLTRIRVMASEADLGHDLSLRGWLSESKN